MKRAVQYSVDILIRNEKENDLYLDDYIQEVLEEKGLCVLGVSFTEDLTEEYRDYGLEELKE